jgi:uncharacterized membrane protein
MKLIVHLFNTNKQSNIAITIMSIYCLSLLIIRANITQNIFLFFLIWNLFLAIIPYLTILYLKATVLQSKLKSYVLLFVWLLFLPNSFYIITDLVHLSQSHDSTFWYDLTLIISFAILGFFLGLLSLFEFEKIGNTLFNQKTRHVLLPMICFLCGFGIYIGRILRYNSWDIISNPIRLIFDMSSELLSVKTMLFSFHFGLFIYLFYIAKKLIINNQSL